MLGLASRFGKSFVSQWPRQKWFVTSIRPRPETQPDRGHFFATAICHRPTFRQASDVNHALASTTIDAGAGSLQPQFVFLPSDLIHFPGKTRDPKAMDHVRRLQDEPDWRFDGNLDFAKLRLSGTLATSFLFVARWCKVRRCLGERYTTSFF